MDSRVDLSMRTAGVLEGWTLSDYREAYQCGLQTLSDCLEARKIDANCCQKENQYFYCEDRIVVPQGISRHTMNG